jgi:hypothetical protein
VRIIWDNRDVENGVITASSEAANFPVANLIDPLRSITWRSQNINNPYLTVDKLAPRYCTVIALINHNLTYKGQIKIKSSNLADFSVLEREEVTFDAWEPIIGYGEGGYGMHGYGGQFQEADRLFYTPNPIRAMYLSPEEARYERITFDDPTNTDGYIEVGIVFCGLYDEYPNPEFGFSYDSRDESEHNYTPGGVRWTDIVPARRLQEFPYEVFDDAYKYWQMVFWANKVGMGKSFIIDPLHNSAKASEPYFTRMYAHLDSYPKITQRNLNISETSIVIEEDL